MAETLSTWKAALTTLTSWLQECHKKHLWQLEGLTFYFKEKRLKQKKEWCSEALTG
jgi:hypothetical protein